MKILVAIMIVLLAAFSESKAAAEKVLAGRVICIDPGHQQKGNAETEPVGPGSNEMKSKMSSGATGVSSKVPEYKLTLAVALKVKTELEKLGATVVMTRESHDVNISNKERAELANKKGAHLVVRIHADGAENPKAVGVSLLTPGKDAIKDEKIIAQSRKAAEEILKAYLDSTGAKSRGVVERNDLAGFNWSTVPTVLIELGFMSNPEEDALMQTPEYQEKMVAGIIKGVAAYLK